ncbi:hypothetical protein ABK040_000565 [Willaertia magna]
MVFTVAESESEKGNMEEKDFFQNFRGRINEIDQLYITKLIWSRISKIINPLEHDVIRRLIGEKLLRENEDLFEELKNLIEILYEYRGETLKNERQIEFTRLSFQGNTSFKQLRQSISSLTELISNDEEKNLKSREKEVLNYVLKPVSPKRPETPRPSSRSSKNSSDGSCSEDLNIHQNFEIKDMEKDLNFINIDKIVGKLREALEDEKRALLEDVEYVRQLLEEEMNYNFNVSQIEPPTLNEVKQVEESLLECVKKKEKEELIKKLPTVESKGSKLKPILNTSSSPEIKKKSSSTVSKLRNVIRQKSYFNPTNNIKKKKEKELIKKTENMKNNVKRLFLINQKRSITTKRHFSIALTQFEPYAGDKAYAKEKASKKAEEYQQFKDQQVKHYDEELTKKDSFTPEERSVGTKIHNEYDKAL